MQETSSITIQKVFNNSVQKLGIDTTQSKQMRAQLRHASTMEPGENPAIWGWIINQTPEEKQGQKGNVSYWEYALYIGLAMNAIGPKEDQETTIAEATAKAGIKRQKLAAVEGASDIKEFQIKLRSLVKLIGSKGIGFNYGEMTKDIVIWQADRIKIVRKWEREYALKEGRNNEQ